jgi:hypothetical protein
MLMAEPLLSQTLGATVKLHALSFANLGLESLVSSTGHAATLMLTLTALLPSTMHE